MCPPPRDTGRASSWTPSSRAGRLLHARPGPAPPPGGNDEPMEDADRDEEEIAETPAVRGAETPTVRGQFLVDGITLEEKNATNFFLLC